jgi:hypothetical protein
VDRASIGSAFDQISKKCLGEILCIVLCDPADVAGTHKLVSNKSGKSSDNALSACCDAVCKSAAWCTTVQRVEAKELSRVVVRNAAGFTGFLLR